MNDPVLVVAFDAAWGGIGCAISDSTHVRKTLYFRPTQTRREQQVWHWLTTVVDREIDAAQKVSLITHDSDVRVVIERIPWNYARGNQTRTVYGLSGLSHIIFAWAIASGLADGHYPIMVPPSGDGNWRKWWGISGNRVKCKATAISLATRLGHGVHLDAHAQIDANGDGARGDVAEAILLSLGVARGCADGESDQQSLSLRNAPRKTPVRQRRNASR